MEVEGNGGGGNTCMSTMVESSGSIESHRFFLARRTVFEMLRDRGFVVDESDLKRTLPEFRAWWELDPDLDRLSVSSTLSSDSSSKVLVFFCGTDPVKMATIREIYEKIKRENLKVLILVLQSKMTSKVRDSIKEIFAFKVENFHITDLLVNITKHVLKPKHEVLTPDEKDKLLKKYSVEDRQLPRMLQNDAVAKYYGLEKGTVVKVSYDSELTGNHVTYRCIF